MRDPHVRFRERHREVIPRAYPTHAQSALAREHGEHRTFSAGSTVAHSSPVGTPHSRTTAGRI
jgi:hypothetical protein